MPNYQYECRGEELVVELNLPIDHETPHCQICNAPLKRVYTAIPVHFKGSGWAGKK